MRLTKLAKFRWDIRILALLLAATTLTGCQTAAQRRVSLLKDRVDKLKPLSHFQPLTCQIEAELTAPARARYAALYPEDVAVIEEPHLEFVWHARRDASDLTASSPSAFMRNFAQFIGPAIKMLLQVYWVHSPFDDLRVRPEDVIEASDGRVFLRTEEGKSFGLYLSDQRFELETRTKGHGQLSAEYALNKTDWLPIRMEQDFGPTQLILDRFEWAEVPVVGRRVISAVWLKAGQGKALDHAHLFFKDCHSD